MTTLEGPNLSVKIDPCCFAHSRNLFSYKLDCSLHDETSFAQIIKRVGYIHTFDSDLLWGSDGDFLVWEALEAQGACEGLVCQSVAVDRSHQSLGEIWKNKWRGLKEAWPGVSHQIDDGWASCFRLLGVATQRCSKLLVLQKNVGIYTLFVLQV